MKLFFFLILVPQAEVIYTITPDADQVAPALKVSHYDCSELTKIPFVQFNQVRPCHITPEELEISNARITLYTKHFRKKQTQPNAEFSTNGRMGIVDTSITVALITLLPE